METYIRFTTLNDFIFCPHSIYNHELYAPFVSTLYHRKAQTQGLHSHKKIDLKSYSTSKNVLMGTEVYSEKYQLCGKIDVYNGNTKTLIERKHKVKTIYDGYIYQVYAQYFALIESGYVVNSIFIQSLADNKRYPIKKPEQDTTMLRKFEDCIKQLKQFNISNSNYQPNVEKCKTCIYSQLCDKSLC